MAGYAYNDGRYTKAAADVQGKRPYSTPKNSLNFWTCYQFIAGAIKGIGAGFGSNYVSDSHLDDANTFTAYATIYCNHSRYRIGRKLKNIANENYWTSSYWA